MGGEFIKLTDIEDDDVLVLRKSAIGCVFNYDHEERGKIVCVSLDHPVLALDGRIEFLVKEDIDTVYHMLCE